MLERMPAAARGCRRGRRRAVAREAPFSTMDRSRRCPPGRLSSGTAPSPPGDSRRLTPDHTGAGGRQSQSALGRQLAILGHLHRPQPWLFLRRAGGLPAPHPGDVALLWPASSGHQEHTHPSAWPLMHQPQPQEMPPARPGSSAWTRSPTQAPHRVSHGSGP